MTINMNAIPTGESDGSKKEQGGGQHGINMRAIRLEPEQTEGKHRGFNLLSMFNPADRRAKAAAEAAKVEALRVKEETQRAQALSQAREQLRTASQGDPRIQNLPQIGHGAARAVADVARTNPAGAVQATDAVIAATQKYNTAVLSDTARRDVRAQSAAVARRRLNEKPITNSKADFVPKAFDGNPDDTVGIRAFKAIGRGVLGVASGVTTLATRTAIAAAMGKPASAFDTIAVDGSGIHVTAPLSSRVTERDIHHGNLGDHDITVDTPGPVDKLVGALSVLPGLNRTRILQSPLGLIGDIVVVDRRSREEIARAATFMPGRRLAEIMGAMREIAPVESVVPNFVPVPNRADLLGLAAGELGESDDILANGVIPAPAGGVSGGARRGFFGKILKRSK